jgi:hypothetical protein
VGVDEILERNAHDRRARLPGGGAVEADLLGLHDELACSACMMNSPARPA